MPGLTDLLASDGPPLDVLEKRRVQLLLSAPHAGCLADGDGRRDAVPRSRLPHLPGPGVSTGQGEVVRPFAGNPWTEPCTEPLGAPSARPISAKAMTGLQTTVREAGRAVLVR